MAEKERGVRLGRRRERRQPGANSAPTAPSTRKLSDTLIENFYMTDPICRSSATMAKCSEAYVTGERRQKPERWRGREPMPDYIQPFLSLGTGPLLDDYVYPGLWILIKIGLIIFDHPERGPLRGLRRAQGDRRHADAARPQRGRPLGAAAVDRRRHQAAAQGNGDPDRRQPGRVSSWRPA